MNLSSPRRNTNVTSLMFAPANLLTAFAALAVLPFTASTLWGAEVKWTGDVSSTFNDGNNWAGAVPGSDDIAINDIASEIDINADWAVAQIQAGYVPADDTDTGIASLVQSGGTVTVGGMFLLGHLANSTASYAITGGTLNLNGTAADGIVRIGWGTGEGLLTISGADTVVNNLTSDTNAWNGAFRVGHASKGKVVQNNGTVSLKRFVLGLNPGGDGTYEIHGGTLNFSEESYLGRNNAKGLIKMTGGTVNATNNLIIGSSTANNRLDGEGTFTLSAGLLNVTGGQVQLGVTGAKGTFNMTGGTFSTNGNLIVGTGTRNNKQSEGFFTLSDGLLDISGGETHIGASGAEGTFNMTGGTVTTDNYFIVGLAANSEGTFTMSGGTFNLENESGAVKAFVVGGNGATGTATISGTAQFNASSADISIGRSTGAAGSNGTLKFQGGTINVETDTTTAGHFNVGAGSRNPANSKGKVEHTAGALNLKRLSGLNIGVDHSTNEGTYELSGTGTIALENWLTLGRDGAKGTLTMTGGSITSTATLAEDHYDRVRVAVGGSGASGTGTLTQSAGSFTSVLSDTALGRDGAKGVWTLSGAGTVDLRTLYLGWTSKDDTGAFANTTTGSSGTFNLNGGTLTVKKIDVDTADNAAATSEFNFNGGTLKASATADGTWITANVKTLAVLAASTIDTNGRDVAIDQALTGAGTLTKTGGGTLSVNGDGTAGIIVSAGALGGTGTVGDITVKSGAVLAPGNSVGTLTAGNVVLEAGATLLVEYDGSQLIAADTLNATGVTFASGSTLFIVVSDSTGLVVGQTVDFFGGSSVDLSNANIQSSGGYTFAYDAGALTVTAVPEPSTYALLGAAGLLGLVALRRRRKA